MDSKEKYSRNILMIYFIKSLARECVSITKIPSKSRKIHGVCSSGKYFLHGIQYRQFVPPVRPSGSKHIRINTCFQHTYFVVVLHNYMEINVVHNIILLSISLHDTSNIKQTQLLNYMW